MSEIDVCFLGTQKTSAYYHICGILIPAPPPSYPGTFCRTYMASALIAIERLYLHNCWIGTIWTLLWEVICGSKRFYAQWGVGGGLQTCFLFLLTGCYIRCLHRALLHLFSHQAAHLDQVYILIPLYFFPAW